MRIFDVLSEVNCVLPRKIRRFENCVHPLKNLFGFFGTVKSRIDSEDNLSCFEKLLLFLGLQRGATFCRSRLVSHYDNVTKQHITTY